MKIILGSNSPRRKELLSQLGLEFAVRKGNFEEVINYTLHYSEIPSDIVTQKLKEMSRNQAKDELIICADTLVFLAGNPIGKPSSKAHAVSILSQLSGKTHEVITAVGISYQDRIKIFSETTEVTFRDLTLAEINYYIKTFNPLDKAGAYGIQDWIGLIGIRSMKGSYTNVIGLPTQRLFIELSHFNIKKGT